MANNGPQTERGKQRKYWTGDGRKDPRKEFEEAVCSTPRKLKELKF